ncbi:MAG TPA: ABC transporter substrate-binding protein [Acidimicrobiia bacterium]|jgi:ABC-type branched-subunit amino acid transport system substrate-binding protein
MFAVVGLAAGSMMALSGGAGATAPRAQGISGNTIKVGGMFDALSFAGADDGFNARISRANKSKELGKYTIDYIGSTDVASSSDKALSTAQNLVEREGVYAIAPVISTGFQQSAGTYAAGKKVPYFGAGFTNAYCTPNTYGISALGCAVGGKYSYNTAINGVAKALGKKPSDLTWAFVGLAIPDGQTTVDNFVKLTKSAGGKVVYSKAVIPQGGGGDLQPFVSAVMDTKPDIVWPLAGAEVLGFTSAMKAAGYTGQMVNSAFYSPGLLTKYATIADTLDGSLVQATSPVVESNSPYVKQLVKDYTAIGKSQADITFGGEYAYMIADLMISAMKKSAPNFDTLVQTVGKGFSYKPPTDGIPLTWPAAYNQSGQCNTIVKINSGKYEIATPYNCNGKRVQVGG